MRSPINISEFVENIDDEKDSNVIEEVYVYLFIDFV